MTPAPSRRRRSGDGSDVCHEAASGRPGERPALQAYSPITEGTVRFMSKAQEAAKNTEMAVDANDVEGLIDTAVVTCSEDVEQEGGYTF